MNFEMIQQDQKPIADPELLEAMVARELQEQPDGKLSKVATGTLIGGNAADLVSTLYALQQGASEANPLLGKSPSAGKLLAVKGAGTLASYLILKRIAKRHPKLANVTALVAGALPAAAAGWNVAQMRRLAELRRR